MVYMRKEQGNPRQFQVSDTDPTFHPFALTQVKGLPPRSLLPILRPVGVGEWFVEGMSSLVSRVAAETAVSVGDFVGRMLSRIPNPYGEIVPAARCARTGGHGFMGAGAINGSTEPTQRLVYAMEAVTCHRNLQWLTLLPFGSALNTAFRLRRAWCSTCFEEWRTTGNVVFEPLLWGLNAVTCCPSHKISLSSICFHCGKSSKPVAVNSWPGYCARCGGWLGRQLRETESQEAIYSVSEAVWASAEIGTLLQLIPEMDPSTAHDALRENLNTYLIQISDGKPFAFARYTDCTGSTVRRWINGTYVPELKLLLRVAKRLEVPVASFYRSGGPTSSDLDQAKKAIASLDRTVAPSRSPAKIREALLTMSARAEKSSLTEVARELGYAGPSRMYQADPGLAREIAKSYRKSGKSHWWKKPGARRICEVDQIQTVLEKELVLDEPRAPDRIGNDLGYCGDGYLRRKFPDLCRAIRKKHAEAKMRRKRNLSKVLRDALLEVPAPSLGDLSRRLGYSNPYVLRSREPVLCNRMKAQYKRFKQLHIAELKTKVAAALSEYPVPPLFEVARRLQVSVKFTRKHFSELAKRIIEQHRITARADTQRKHREAYEAVMRVAVQLNKEGIYPCRREVCARLTDKICGKWELLTAAIRSAQKSLGFHQ
jgi:hypothetical protein